MACIEASPTAEYTDTGLQDIVQIEVDPAAAAEINAKLTVAVQIEVVVVMRGDDDGEETRKRQRWGEERGCGDDGRGRDEPCGRCVK